MAANSPTRIDDDLFAAAKAAGALLSRSAAQQVNHWARIGRQLEASASVSSRDIARVLAGEQSYDELPVREQALVRATWDERIAAARVVLDFTAEPAASGVDWADTDAAGDAPGPGAAPPAANPPPAPRVCSPLLYRLIHLASCYRHISALPTGVTYTANDYHTHSLKCAILSQRKPHWNTRAIAAKRLRKKNTAG